MYLGKPSNTKPPFASATALNTKSKTMSLGAKPPLPKSDNLSAMSPPLAFSALNKSPG